MSLNSSVNASFNRHRRSCTADTLARLQPASLTSVDSATLVSMVPLEAFEDVMATAIELLVPQFCHTEPKYGPPLRSYFQGHQGRLAQRPDGWRQQYRTIRDIQERDKKIEEQRARIEALEAEVARLKQEEIELVNVYEEQDTATMQDLYDVYQLVLDMERDVQASESTRVRFRAQYIEEQAQYLALESALEQERQVTSEQRKTWSQAALVQSTAEQHLCDEVSALRADVDHLRKEVDAMKTDAGTIHTLAEEKAASQSRIGTLKRQLRGQELLVMEVQKIEHAEIMRLAAERDDARKTANRYARRLQTLKHAPSSRSHTEGLTPAPETQSSSVKEKFDAYRSLSTALVKSLTLERDLLREQRMEAETEKVNMELKMVRLEEELCEVNRCRQDEHKAYYRQFLELKATITKLTRERDEARGSPDATLVHVPSQAVLKEAPSSTGWEFQRRHERTATVNASVVTQQRLRKTSGGILCNGTKMLDGGTILDTSISIIDASDNERMSSGERSFGPDHFRSTSTPLPISLLGDSQSDGNISFAGVYRGSQVNPLHDPRFGPEEWSSDGITAVHPSFDMLWLCEPQALSTVDGTEALDYFGCAEGQSSISSSPHFSSTSPISEVSFPWLSSLTRETGTKYTCKYGLISDPPVHRIRNECVTCIVGTAQDYSRYELLLPSWSDPRAFEPP